MLLRPMLHLALALLPASAGATSVRSLSVRELLARAELVFEGRSVAAEVREEAPGGAIRTCVRFEVLEVLKGPAVTGPLELCFAGGSVGRRTQRVHGLRVPPVGERGLYFVEDLDAPRLHPLTGWDQGRFRVRETREPAVETADGEPVLAIEADAPAGATALPRAARGARLAAPGGRGMAPEAFKARLRALLAEAAP